jgi:arginine deiminase
MITSARAEWDKLTDVLIHRPGIEMFMGLLEPYSFLYERAFSMDGAIFEHLELEHALDSAGVMVHRLKRTAIRIAKENPQLMERVRSYTAKIVKFEGPAKEARKARQDFSRNLELLDAETLFNILLLRPTLKLRQGRGTRVIFPHVTLNVPLANLYFMRDQQALTDLGFVMSRMSKPQRQLEPFMTGMILELMGAKVVYQVQPPGTFEGGDFIPAGEFAMIGLGDRTNRNAVNQIMSKGIGFNEVAVVHQATHPLIPGNERDPMINMHLDTYLNIAGNGVAVGCEPLLKRAPTEVYSRTSSGKYVRNGEATNVYEYLMKKGFKIIPITTVEQLCYASNFLCVKDHHILAVEVEKVSERVLKNLEAQAKANPKRYSRLYEHSKKEYRELRENGQFFPHKRELYELNVEATPVMLDEITGGYGGAHCMTCALNREAS